MALGIVSDAEFELEISRHDVVETPHEVSSIIKDSRGAGCPEDRPHIPDVIKNLVIEEKLLGTPEKTIQKLFDVSSKTITSAVNGLSNSNPGAAVSPQLKAFSDRIRESINNQAHKKIKMALNHITGDKMKDASIRDLAATAKDMAVIVRTLEPAREQIDKNQNNYIFMVPPPISEDKYEVIDVGN